MMKCTLEHPYCVENVKSSLMADLLINHLIKCPPGVQEIVKKCNEDASRVSLWVRKYYIIFNKNTIWCFRLRKYDTVP